MNYLMSRCNCVLEKNKFPILKNVLYQIEQVDEKEMLIIEDGLFILNLKSKNVLKFSYNSNNYFLVNPAFNVNNFSCSFMANKNLISISISNELKIVINGNVEKQTFVTNIEYKCFEIVGDVTIIYFEGKRNFVVIIQKEKVVEAMYYDELNVNGEEKWFMMKLYDSLNHGKVVHISGQKVDNYLVYLDDNDLNLKTEFVAHVFLDCLISGNYKYCNNLLCEELKQKDEKEIKTFFPEFDFVYPVENNVFALIRKNTLAGIYKFEINNLLIENVIDET